MRLRVNVEMQNVTLFAPGGAGSEFAAVRHHHFDGVVARMDILFHRQFPGTSGAPIWGMNLGALYSSCLRAASRRHRPPLASRGIKTARNELLSTGFAWGFPATGGGSMWRVRRGRRSGRG